MENQEELLKEYVNGPSKSANLEKDYSHAGGGIKKSITIEDSLDVLKTIEALD
ncbi:MAG: hypothetical protein JKY15_02085 [Deltaproteobacteria bacterium]|nr:hypothetical protein [Deltaproteobacteria bacterium]